MISLQNVSKIYRSVQGEVRALDDLTLELGEGEFVAVRGSSGSGKSTLLSIVGGLAVPSSGEVTVAGQPLHKLSAGQRAEFRARHIGFVFQLFHLLPYLTVLENILLADNKAASNLQERAESLVERFGLADRKSHRPPQLSAGERQRVAMARAILNEPKLLLADEPTGNLDPGNARVVLDLIADFHNNGGTVLLVTHEDHAARYAQRTIELDRGRILTGQAVPD
jgi:putative ABC transport system ATP-binding protein